MLVIKKKTEDKRVNYSGENSNEQTTSINFEIFDGSNQVGEGSINSAYPGMPQTGNLTASFTLRSSDFTPESIFAKIPVLLQEGGAQ